MLMGCLPSSAIPFMSGANGCASGANWRSGATATCTMSACPGSTSFTRPKSRFGGLEQQPGRRCLFGGTPAIYFSEQRTFRNNDRESAMTALRLDNLRQHSDILRLRSGQSLTVRLVEPQEGEALQAYFRSLTTRSRYNRFLGAMSELPQNLLAHFTHAGEDDQFSVIATVTVDGRETIVGEARYGFG